jgi:steroid delta-isomerase-like uncharacterized protein
MPAADQLLDSSTLTANEERNLRAVTDVLQFWNTQDIDGILAFYDDDITWTNVALEETYHGKDEVRAFLGRLFHAFPDLSFDVTYKFVAGDQIAERWAIRGTHLGAFMGVPPTKRRVEIPGMGMVVMRDGKFYRDYFFFDMASSMRQMGLLPPLAMTDTPIMRAALWLAVNRRVTGIAAGVAGLLTALLFGRRRS